MSEINISAETPPPPGYTWCVLSFTPPTLVLGCLRCGVMVANPEVHDSSRCVR